MKQLFYKPGLLILTVIVFIATGGCNNFLDRKPLGIATDGDLTVGGLEGKVFGLYGKLRDESGMADLSTLFFKSVRSDDAQKGSTPGDIGELTDAMDNYQYTKDHWLLNGYWDGHFNFIYACNDVLHEIDSLKLTDPASLVNEAEAKFMRAYAYFDLVRDYGEVPIIDFKVYQPGDANKPKNTVAEIYTFIDSDLDFADANLPMSWVNQLVNQFPGRLTKGAANTLHAKTKLYRKDWAGALAKCEQVINSGQYSLLGNYSDFFKESGENSTESIFEIQLYQNTNGSVTYGSSYNQVQGIRGSGDWDLGWGFNVPTTALDGSYETGDPRRGATILYEGQPDGIYGRTLPIGLAQPMWNKKVYTDPARQSATGDRFGQWLNVRVLRYADVLLMAAESANEIGEASKALGYLEQVRARARGSNPVLPQITTTDQGLLRTAIKKERRAEFGMEWERFYDLVRWVPAPDGIDALTVLGPLGYLNKCRFYPLPLNALDKNPQLVQNPEW